METFVPVQCQTCVYNVMEASFVSGQCHGNLHLFVYHGAVPQLQCH